MYIKAIQTALLAAAALLAGPLPAQEDPPPPPPIREPLPPKVGDADEQIEPEVRIRRDEDGRTVEEYVSQGRVYMVKITPVVGPPYYLMDTTGDGILNLRHDRFEPVKPVYWKIFEW